jgi:signal transduction histidine kinase
MRRRLLTSTGVIALVAVLVLGIPLGFVGARFLSQRSEQRLEREADAAAVELAARIRRGQPVDSAAVASLAGDRRRLVAVLPGGRRVVGGDGIGPDPVRVRAGESDPVAVTILAPREESEDYGGVWLAVIVLSLVAVAAAVGLALVQARRLAGPMERLAERAGSLGHAGDPDAHPSSGIAEVDRIEAALADADRRIADALRHEREFSANASHQLRSPLTGLRMRLEELAGLAGDDAVTRQEAEAALARADRLMDVIAHLEELARVRDGMPELLDLAALACDHVRASTSVRASTPAGGSTVNARPAAA